jgi:two-component system sensor histidine kinase CpxA
MPLDGDYVIVAEVQPPSPLQRMLDPYGLTLRLGAAFLVIVLVSYFLARSLSAPLRELREAARELGSGNLSVRVSPALRRRRDEIADLGQDFDRMAERITALLETQKRLLTDISHELRSPLARLNVALALARQKAPPDAEPPLDRIEREAARLNDLIGQLLTLTVLESGADAVPRVTLDLTDLVREIAEDADFEARSTGRGVRLMESQPLRVEGARELLGRAIENVLRNAVRFTAEGTDVGCTSSDPRAGGPGSWSETTVPEFPRTPYPTSSSPSTGSGPTETVEAEEPASASRSPTAPCASTGEPFALKTPRTAAWSSPSTSPSACPDP